MEKDKKIAINFVNKFFIHFFITNINISSKNISPVNASCNSIKSNCFAYITINKYFSDNFYKIMIDTNAIKYSIINYKQYITVSIKCILS